MGTKLMIALSKRNAGAEIVEQILTARHLHVEI